MTSASTSCCPWWAATLQSPSLSTVILCFSITKTFLIQEFITKIPSSSLQNQLLLPLKKWLWRFLKSCMCECRSEVNLRYLPPPETLSTSLEAGSLIGLELIRGEVGRPPGARDVPAPTPRLWDYSTQPHAQHLCMGSRHWASVLTLYN